MLREYPVLLDPFMGAALNKVNVHDNPSVTQACNLMSEWFTTAAERSNGVLPHNVHLSFFFEACQVLLDSQQFQVILKTLVLLYDHLNCFPEEVRSRFVASILLDKFFFKLFLHWLEEVRFFFCHLLVFKLFRTSRWEVFRFMEGMEYLSALNLAVPRHLVTPSQFMADEGYEDDFCICSKFAFYLGIVLEQVDHAQADKVAREHRPYSKQAVQQFTRVVKMSYECGVEDFPVLNFNPKK